MSYREDISQLMKKSRYTFDDLVTITRILRSEVGCPWDREQDHHSVRICLLEETYEVAEAIDTENPVLLREELGDLLYQVVFHAQLECEEERFDISHVIDDISKKMIHRHPHVFGDVQVENSVEVLKNWESIKTEEKQRNTLVDKLRAIPPMMPALMRASKVGKKAGQAKGMSTEELLAAVEEKLVLVKEASLHSDAKAEIGDLLMSVTDLSRALDVDAEHALMMATDRLIDRFVGESVEKI